MIKPLYTKYRHEETGISAKLSLDKVTFKNSAGGKEFVFQNSNKKTARKVLQAMLNLLDHA